MVVFDEHQVIALRIDHLPAEIALAEYGIAGDQTPLEDQTLEQSFGVAFLTPPDQIAARYSLGCDCRSCLASTFRPVGVSIFSASSFSSRCSAS